MKTSTFVKISTFVLFGLVLVPSVGLAQVAPQPIPLFQGSDVVTYPNFDYGNVLYFSRNLIAPPSPVTTYFPISPYMLPRQYPSYPYPVFHPTPEFVLPPFAIPDWYSQCNFATPCENWGM
jgi:hypothetical protein